MGRIAFLCLFLFLMHTSNAQSVRHWLGLNGFSRGPLISYGLDLGEQSRVLAGLRLGILSRENRPAGVFPGLEIQYQHQLYQAGNGPGAAPVLWIGPWTGINRIPSLEINPRFAYWSFHAGLQIGYRIPIMGSSHFAVEGTLGLGYSNTLLNAPDYFFEDEFRYRTILERWQAPYEGLYPRLGVSVYYGVK